MLSESVIYITLELFWLLLFLILRSSYILYQSLWSIYMDIHIQIYICLCFYKHLFIQTLYAHTSIKYPNIKLTVSLK